MSHRIAKRGDITGGVDFQRQRSSSALSSPTDSWIEWLSAGLRVHLVVYETTWKHQPNGNEYGADTGAGDSEAGGPATVC